MGGWRRAEKWAGGSGVIEVQPRGAPVSYEESCRMDAEKGRLKGEGGGGYSVCA